MSKRKYKFVIGLHFAMFMEIGYRLMDGALRYVSQHSDLGVADFPYYQSEHHFDTPPPWLGRADGVVIGAGKQAGFLEWLEQGRVPVVNCSDNLLDTTIPAAFIDAESVARLAIDHSVRLGRTRLLHVGYRDYAPSERRRAALAKVIGERDLRLNNFEVSTPIQIDRSGHVFMPDSDKAALRKSLESLGRPLAILTINDICGQAVCELLNEMGWEIPGDASLLSVGDSARVRTCEPPLSAIHPPNEQLGYEATRMLHRILEGKRLAQRNLPVPAKELVARESTVGNHRHSRADVNHALELIRRRACEGLRVEDLVRQLRVPLRTFELQFSRIVGHSLGEEIRNVRLERAKELLTTTDLSLTRIAGLIGYATSAYFTRFFRKHTGLLPSVYRRQQSTGKHQRPST